MDLQLSQSSESTDDSVDTRVHAIESRKRRTTRNEMDDEEYKRRRERNNEAVRKCRIKSRQKSKEMAEKVCHLREENAILTQKVQILSKELTLLKELFLTHAKSSNQASLALAIAKSQAVTDAVVPQTDHEYVVKSNGHVKVEPVDSDEDIVDLSVRRPGMVLDRPDAE